MKNRNEDNVEFTTEQVFINFFYKKYPNGAIFNKPDNAYKFDYQLFKLIALRYFCILYFLNLYR